MEGSTAVFREYVADDIIIVLPVLKMKKRMHIPTR